MAAEQDQQPRRGGVGPVELLLEAATRGLIEVLDGGAGGVGLDPELKVGDIAGRAGVGGEGVGGGGVAGEDARTDERVVPVARACLNRSRSASGS